MKHLKWSRFFPLEFGLSVWLRSNGTQDHQLHIPEVPYVSHVDETFTRE